MNANRKNRQLKLIIYCLCLLPVLYLHSGAQPAFAAGRKAATPADVKPTEFVVDTIIASVNGKPITLRQLGSRLRPPRQIDIKQAASNPEARYMLDVLILEQVIQDEADARKISVSDQEIDRYLEEVAGRNNLSKEGFEQALLKEGRGLDEYRKQVRLEILKSRLSGAVAQAGAGVTNEEIRKYIKDHPELAKSGSRIQLSQIYIGFQDKSFENAKQLVEKARERLAQEEEFAVVAKELSDGPEAKDGGSLGLMAEEDLNPVMFDAVFSLKKGQISDIITSDNGFHIFKLEKRLKKKSSGDSKIEEEVRASLEKDKLASRMQDYFTTDIFKKHSIDKKI